MKDNIKAQANNVPAWMYEQAMKQERKADKSFRQQRQTRKTVWLNSEN